MEGKFYLSTDYMKYMDIIHTATKDTATVIAAAGKALEEIADDFGIGMVRAVLSDASNPSYEVPKYDEILYENRNDISDEVLSDTFYSRRIDKLSLYISRKNSAVWSENDRKCLMFIMKNMATAFDRARMSELLIDARFHDMMTGLCNTDGFIMGGSRIINMRLGAGYTALYFNLTNFKYVNKAVSYHGGDQALIIYAGMLRDRIGEDEIVGRLGGDNFVAMIKNDNLEDFLKYIFNVEITIENNGESHQFVFGATVGAFRIDDTVTEMGRVMMAVSSAYQVAKEEQHQSLVYCTPDMFLKLVQGKEILMKFPNALVNKEFLVFYQPKVDSRTDCIVGAEALARWKRGSEIVPPAAFIPMLERNGEICNLDFYIFDMLCADIRRWMDEGRDIPIISSNFSRWHLRNEGFVDRLIQIADKYNVDHRYLEIEVTETTNVSEYNTLLDVVRQIKQAGMSVSIDDFGTGYSSLNMLKEIPVDVLKLDKSLIDHSGNSNNDKIMLKHIVGLADDMKIKVLAEGVETKDQREYLKTIGCNYIQGYLYDKPLMPRDFEKRMAQGKYSI